MKAFHLLGAAPLYTNSFVLISDAGHAVVIDPAAEVQEYDKIFKENNATLTTILCTHGHYDHVGSAGVLSREWKARIYCEPADCRGSQLFPLKSADSGYAEGEKLTVDELTFTVWHTPGHTEGGVVLLCGDYLFVGDTVFQGSIGRTDLEGGSMQKMDASLRKLAAAHPQRDPAAAWPRGFFHPWRGTGEQLLYPQRPARRECGFLRIKREKHEDLYYRPALRLRGGASGAPVLPYGSAHPHPAGRGRGLCLGREKRG